MSQTDPLAYAHQQRLIAAQADERTPLEIIEDRYLQTLWGA